MTCLRSELGHSRGYCHVRPRPVFEVFSPKLTCDRLSATNSGGALTKLIDTGRRLVTIFATDVGSCSRLMGTDESGSLRDLTLRRQLVDKLIASDRGRIANTAGYCVLDESGNADPIQRAVEAQEAFAEANTRGVSRPSHDLRIGATNSSWFLTSRPPKRSVSPVPTTLLPREEVIK